MINITINYKEKTINIDLKVKFEVERLLFKHVLFTQTNHALQCHSALTNDNMHGF